MMTSTELDRLMAEDTAQREAAVARVIERGGLPTLQDVAELERSLTAVHGMLEGFAMAAEAVGNAHGEVEVPFPVTAEHIAALALIVEQIAHDVGEFGTLAGRIRGELQSISYVRREQVGAASGSAADSR